MIAWCGEKNLKEKNFKSRMRYFVYVGKFDAKKTLSPEKTFYAEKEISVDKKKYFHAMRPLFVCMYLYVIHYVSMHYDQNIKMFYTSMNLYNVSGSVMQ